MPKRISLYDIYKEKLLECSGLAPGPVVDAIMDSFVRWVEGGGDGEHQVYTVGDEGLDDEDIERLWDIAIESVAWVCSGLTEHGLLQRDERRGDAS